MKQLNNIQIKKRIQKLYLELFEQEDLLRSLETRNVNQLMFDLLKRIGCMKMILMSRNKQFMKRYDRMKKGLPVQEDMNFNV